MRKRNLSRAVFLDRDGVLNAALWNPAEAKWDSPYSLQDLHILPGVPEAVRRINGQGFLAVVVSNQPGVAKAKCNEAFLHDLTSEMVSRIGAAGALIDAVYYCRHHPEALRPHLRKHCQCRKPRPGLLFNAARDLGISLADSYMIGDSHTDVQAGLAAGCRTVLVGQKSSVGLPSVVRPHLAAPDLAAAITAIFDQLPQATAERKAIAV